MKKNRRPLILDDQLGFNVYRVALLFRRELIRSLSDYSMTPEQWQALASLWIRDSMTQSEIAEITLQDAPSLSRMIARMEKNGWVVKKSDPGDRRATRIHLTAAGRRLEGVLPDRIIGHFNEYLKSFPVSKRKQLTELLIDLRIGVNDRKKPFPGSRV